MSMDWFQASQVNFGLILKGVRPSQAYSSNEFAPPFDEMLEFIKKKDDWCKEDLYSHFAPSELDGALHAIQSLNGSSKDVDWPAILRESAAIWEISDDLERVGRAGKKGKLPDVFPLVSKLKDFSNGEKQGLRKSLDVDWQSAKGLQPSGWDIIDNTIGGIAESGPIVVCAPTKTGKSFFTAKLAERFLNHYTDRRVAIFPLELTDKRYLKRSFEMYPDMLKPHEEGRIFTSSKTRTIEGIASDVGTMGDCGLIIVDGIDGLVKGSYETSKFAGAWSGIIELGVVLDIPIVVTAQPNRVEKYNSKSKFLDMYAIEWSGAAENGAEQLWVLQHVPYANDFDDERFPVFDDAYYIISWLQREGWMKQKGPGAVILKDHKYDKNGNIRLWEGEAYQNLLWRPGAARAKIGNKSSRIVSKGE